ncbi:uncharacterized protein LOC129261808 [Lytechinus pictus]|uniref:uncharacterized protein LOC129261808 n=1 Tax=Lytechinus pictus TaxID=7653 RepID=UPI00240D4461|nr:uncharacterized protein LOC129261808 [Lytechinus pictus]XP_054755825.1 uncharacterized protein LOC129261814 [Lytechinus pictus]
MVSSAKIICLVAFLSALCLVAEARAKFPGVAKHIGSPQKQTQINPQAPMAQTDASASASSESMSSETDDDDAAANTAAAAAPAAAAPAPIGGNLPMLAANGRQLPNTGARDPNQMFGRGSGSSGKSVGVAFAVLALIAVVVAGAYFGVRKYRPHLVSHFTSEDE